MTLLVGEKVRLIPVTDRNLREFFDLWNGPSLSGDYVEFAPRNWSDFQDFAKGSTKFLVEKISDSSRIGWIDYYLTRSECPYLFEIGYALNPSEWRKGYMSEAAKLVVEYVFSTTNIEKIEALTDTENLGSQRVLEKAGFKREGTLRKRYLVKAEYRDDFIYGILREEWKK